MISYDYRLDPPEDPRCDRAMRDAEIWANDLYDRVLLPLDERDGAGMSGPVRFSRVIGDQQDGRPVFQATLRVEGIPCDGFEAIGLAERLEEIAKAVRAEAVAALSR